MNFALVAIILALIWTAITGQLTLLNLMFGGVIGLIALWIVRQRVATPLLLSRLRRIISLALLFFYELALSAFRVAALVVSPNMTKRLNPAIIAFPLTARSDVEITLLANLITLTPGTLSVDVSEDRKYIYVHCINAPDKQAVIDEIASGFEAKIIEVFE
jgi:multicomponent Na+:H+ antiporter subunit E